MNQNIKSAEVAFEVTPSADLLPSTTRALYFGAAGDATVLMPDGTSVLFKAVPVGTVLPVSCIKVTAGPAYLVALV